MTIYNLIRFLTVKDYNNLQSIINSFDYDFEDGDAGEVFFYKLLIPNVVSIAHNNITTSLDNLTETNYKTLYDDYIVGIEIDEENALTIPLEERSCIVFGKKGE
jgi:hypothetical protein